MLCENIESKRTGSKPILALWRQKTRMRENTQYNVKNLLKAPLLTAKDLFVLGQIVYPLVWLLLVRTSFALLIWKKETLAFNTAYIPTARMTLSIISLSTMGI